MDLSPLDQRAFWESLNPGLCISDYPFRNSLPFSFPDVHVNQSFRNLKEEGYFKTPPLLPGTITTPLAAAVLKVVSAGFPAVFAFVYDEFWGLVRQVEQIFIPILGGKYLLSPGDMWIWHLDQNGKSTGWGPHRDLQDTSCLRPDGSARMLTVWIPLTDASPLNGCMYLLPLHRDPDYPLNLANRSVGVDSLQNMRALPAGSGSLLGWTPMILHWGAHHSGHNVGPRTSVAFYLNDGGNDLGGGISVSENTFVPFWYRLGAIGAMISLFDGSPLAKDLRFPDSLKSALKPYLDRVIQPLR